jgi:hemoglobin
MSAEPPEPGDVPAAGASGEAREPTPFDRLGGDRLREVITDFYRRVFDDVMIGFMFAGKDRARLIEKEWEMAARMLGGDVRYTGRAMPAAHARVPITGGHFDRRTQILRDTLAAHQVPRDIQDVWLGHVEALRAQLTADKGSDCDHDAAASRTEVAPAPSGPVRLGRK